MLSAGKGGGKKVMGGRERKAKKGPFSRFVVVGLLCTEMRVPACPCVRNSKYLWRALKYAC